MAFKKTFPFLLAILFLSGPLFSISAEDPREGRSDLSDKNNTELIAMERSLQEKVGKDPSNVGLYLELSEVYNTLFDRTRKKNAQANEWIAKSANVLERVVMIDPKHKTALYNLGVVYKRQGQMERAREELRKALRACDPKTDGYLLTAIWMQIGMVYEEQGFFDDAQQAYEKALEYDYGSDDIRDTIRDLKEKKAEAAANGSASSYNVGPGMGMGNYGAAARSYDPMSGADMQKQGLEQLVPALSSLASQKFSGQQRGQGDDDQS